MSKGQRARSKERKIIPLHPPLDKGGKEEGYLSDGGKGGLLLFALRSILIALCFMLYAFPLFADNIKVLIVNDTYSKIPSKTEKMKKIGSVRGDLLVTGSRYSGNIDIWKGDNGLYLVNELPIEDYVRDVVVAEVGSNWEMEALKAQAVISRTYAVYQKRMNGDSIYHIASSVLHQVYKGDNPDAKAALAVEETSKEILTYDGKPIEALYHSTCGGRTENPEDVFGKSYPYLKSVESNCEISPYWTWERRIRFIDIEKALNLSGIKEILIKSYTSTNRVKQLDIINESGITTINATDLRKALGWSILPSTNFKITLDGDSIIFEGKGYGHGVGLCQWSALQMAREGKNYKEILSFFYPGTTIQLYEGR
jgi:stage II sporulation protein D